MPERYDRVAIALHWILVVGILFQIWLGLYLSEVPRNTPPRTVWVNFHKSVGITLGFLILFRLYWRLTHRPPPLPGSMPRWQRVTARANHALLYACMIGMPLAGYIASNFSRFGIRYFNLVELPPWGIDDRRIYDFFNATHKTLAVIFIALIALHVLAALKHGLVDRDGVLRRMWPTRADARRPARRLDGREVSRWPGRRRPS
jgi:cytochrome b561